MRPLLLLLACAAAAAHAHVTLEQPQAAAGSSYKAVLRVTHGCEGTATHTVRVTIPPGFRGAKPMPKPGWTLDVRKEKLAQPYESHGRTVTDDVVEITWAAASREAWLANAHFDEFVLLGQTPQQPGVLWFKVQQICERGQWNWSEVPTDGINTTGLKAPAVPLEVTSSGQAAHHSHH
ncbi:MAG TPA: YcnI family protein [Burkholderiaceae bacterium]|jgi:uncharacterized protein YcnI|nr:YcnI family protein [Burkholderiaceae bacterium]